MNLLDMIAVALYIVAITVASLVDGEQKMWGLLPLCLAVMANEAAGKCVSAAQVFFTVAIIVFVAADGAQKAGGIVPMLLSLAYIWGAQLPCSRVQHRMGPPKAFSDAPAPSALPSSFIPEAFVDPFADTSASHPFDPFEAPAQADEWTNPGMSADEWRQAQAFMAGSANPEVFVDEWRKAQASKSAGGAGAAHG